MRFMGENTSPFPFPLPSALPGFTKMDPAVKAAMLVQAATAPDYIAEDLADIADATPYGKQQRYVRMGLGAALGLVVGVVACRVLKKKK